MKLNKLLILIVLLGAFVRFYNLPNIAYFEFDDQYNSYLIYNLFTNHKISLVGQETSFGGLFLGPWHYLFLAPFYLLTNLHPIGGFIGEGVIGLLTIISYYFVASKLFSPKVGLLAAFLRAITVSSITRDLNIGPAYPAEIVGLWFIYFLTRLLNKSEKAFIYLSFLFGMMFSVHLVILPLTLVWFLILIIKRPIKLNPKLLGLSLLAFIIPVTPILIFEIKHKFVHILMFIETLLKEGRTAGDFMNRLIYELQFSIGNFYTLFDNRLLPWWVGILFFGLLVFFIWKKKGEFDKDHKFLFVTIFMVTFIYYLFYPRHVPEYYFMPLIILSFLYIPPLLVTISKVSKIGLITVVVFLGIVLYSNIISLFKMHNNQTKFALAQKDQAVKSIVDHQRGKGEFSISYFTQFGRQYGFQYFFTYYGLEPRKDIKPPIYSLVLPRSQVAQDDLSVWFGDIGVIFPEKEPEQGK